MRYADLLICSQFLRLASELSRVPHCNMGTAVGLGGIKHKVVWGWLHAASGSILVDLYLNLGYVVHFCRSVDVLFFV